MCKFVLNEDHTFFIYDNSNERLVQNGDIMKSLCLNNCSSNGECTDTGK